MLLIILAFAFQSTGCSESSSNEAIQPSAAQTGGQKATSRKLASPRDDVPGVSNFAKVSEVLYRGAQPDRQGFTELKRLGIKTIVNLRTTHSDREELKGLGFDYFEIPVIPTHLEDDQILSFLRIVSDSKQQPVFVHCKRGADRTGAMVAMYRMVEQQWPRKQATDELSNFDFHPIWVGLRGYLENVDVEKIRKLLKNTTMPDRAKI